MGKLPRWFISFHRIVSEARNFRVPRCRVPALRAQPSFTKHSELPFCFYPTLLDPESLTLILINPTTHLQPPSKAPLYAQLANNTTNLPKMASMHLSQLRKWMLESPPVEYGLQRLRQLLIGALRQGRIPQHIAFVMDGNRRFARSHQIETIEGHNLGFESLARVCDTIFLYMVHVLVC